MVIFVHVASVWVPFTSESKEAIADYDEIRKEIKLALQECGRRLGVFLRRRQRAESAFHRRSIFDLYIEEIVEACARLRGGHLAKDTLRSQLQRMAVKRTGGSRTDELLGHDSGPEGLPHSIVVTPGAPEGDLPAASGAAPREVGPSEADRASDNGRPADGSRPDARPSPRTPDLRPTPGVRATGTATPTSAGRPRRPDDQARAARRGPARRASGRPTP
jgi:DNA topoisomerase-6 subunit B